MSLTIDEAITRFEANAEQNERWANAGLNPEANAEYAAEHRQLAAWLRELQELREAPEIIFCSECAHFKDNGSTVGYCKRKAMYQFTDYFCGDAERRTE